MKKKLIIIIPIVLALLGFVVGYYYFNSVDGNTNLTISDKKWLEENNAEKIDFEVFSDVPIFGMNGSGVVDSFIADFSEATSLSFTKIPYLKDTKTTTTGFRVRILGNDEKLTNKDLLIAEDNYVLLSKNGLEITRASDINNAKIAVFNDDIADLTYYLNGTIGNEFVGKDTIDDILLALTNDEVTMVIIPKMLYLDKYIANKALYINYNFTEMSKKIVLTLNNEDTKLNGIMKKYYEFWKENNYVSTYNKAYLDLYLTKNNVNDKNKADLISKTYVYGYVENAPYESNIDGEAQGIAAEYINRVKRLANLEIEYKEYKTAEELKKAISNGEVDIYFNYDESSNEKYIETNSPFIEQYVVLAKTKNDQVITSFESLKGINVNILKNNALYNYFKDNSRAVLIESDSISKLTSNDNLIVVDKEVYSYYRNSKFSSYEVIYVDSMTNDYSFMVKNDNDDLYELFNYIMMTNSYQKYRNSGLNNLDLSLLERTSFEELYFIILGIILLPLLVFVAIYLFMRRKRYFKEVKKEDRRKYTDMLTSLKNRNYLNLNIPLWDESKVYPQAIVVIDLNNVKYVNDNYGHEAGDNLIIKAASTLVNTQLENSEIIRTDGNEFLLYLVGYSEQQVTTYTKKLTKEMKDLPYGFGAAVGFSMITDSIKTIDDAINEAVIEMRKQKEDNK